MLEILLIPKRPKIERRNTLSTHPKDVTCITLLSKTLSIGKWFGMYFIIQLLFQWIYSIDATEESNYLGRLVNHSRNGNLTTKAVEVEGKPHLVLVAKKDIDADTEVLYDYGDRSKQALEHHPWLAL